MIEAIIIDDEKGARFVLRDLLEKHFNNIKIVAEADGVKTGIDVIKKYKPNLVFLDVQMRKGTGFDLLNELDPINFEVIFVTAHNQYAIDAFKLSAFGYLLKPIKVKELGEVISKLQEKVLLHQQNADKRLKVLIENYGSDGEIQKLIISNTDGFEVVDIKQVIRLEGDGNYTHFVINKNKKMTSTKNIGEYEKILDSYGFFRIHQSTLINLRHVKGYIKGGGGFVKMSDGQSLKISRDRKKSFLNKF